MHDIPTDAIRHPECIEYHEGDALVWDWTKHADRVLKRRALRSVAHPEHDATFEVVSTDQDGLPVWA